MDRVEATDYGFKLGRPDHPINQKISGLPIRTAKIVLDHAGNSGSPRTRHPLGLGVHGGIQGDGDSRFHAYVL